METPFLIGEEIYLRPLRESDLPLFARWFNDPDVRRTSAGSFPATEMGERKWMENLAKDSVHLVVTLKDDDRPIGVVDLDGYRPIHRSATFGITIGEKDCWDKGYGTEATRLICGHGFNTLNLHRIELTVFDFNPRGLRAYEKAGFVREGVKREAHAMDGGYRDIVVMSILEDDYRAER